jgi:flagellar biosynthetic protein FlhB
MSQEKTEKPTRRRLTEARKEGQSARSAEAAPAAGLLAIVAVLPSTVTSLRAAVDGSMKDAFEVASRPDDGAAMALLRDSMVSTGRAVLPAVAVIGAISIITQLAVVGGRPNLYELRPRFDRINLFKGLKRLVSKTMLWELARSALKLGAVALVLAATWDELRGRFFGGLSGIPEFVGVLGDGIDTMLARAAMLGVFVAVIDVVVARRRFLKSVRMSKQDVREEMRHSEGDPHVKGEVRRRMTKMSRLRMMADVGKATVVLTNPTHFAVALRYTEDDPAPIVVAKGADAVAQRIKAEAAKHNVPTIENKPLTRALFRATDIGDAIPADLYQAVAEVLAVLWRSGRTS